MTQRKNQFRWIDRDTAGRQLLQVALNAPPFISRRAMLLLKAIRSPALIPDLIDIYLHSNDYDYSFSYYALQALQATPNWYETGKYPEIDARLQDEDNFWRWMKGLALASAGGADLYLPHLAKKITEEFAAIFYKDDDVIISDNYLIPVVHLCPSNWDWFYARICQLQPATVIRNHIEMHNRAKGHLRKTVAYDLKAYLDEHREMLAPECLAVLVESLSDEDKRLWLDEQRDVLIYVCLAYPIKHIYKILRQWDALKQAVINNCPAIVPELEAMDKIDPPLPTDDFRDSPVYKQLLEWQKLLLDKKGTTKEIREKIWQKLTMREMNPALFACCLHLLENKITHWSSTIIECNAMWWNNSEVRPTPPHDDYLPSWEVKKLTAENVYSPVRFEAGEILRDTPRPYSWEALMNAFFIEPRPRLEPFMLDWITHVTDQLEGVHTAYTGRLLPIEERPWFIELTRMPEDVLAL